jgi:hypothetical protein
MTDLAEDAIGRNSAVADCADILKFLSVRAAGMTVSEQNRALIDIDLRMLPLLTLAAARLEEKRIDVSKALYSCH